MKLRGYLHSKYLFGKPFLFLVLIFFLVSVGFYYLAYKKDSKKDLNIFPQAQNSPEERENNNSEDHPIDDQDGVKRGVLEPNIYSKEKIFSLIEKAKLVGTFNVGRTARLGSLSVTLYETKEGTYRSLTLDKDNQRINEGYFSAHIKVYNRSYSTTEEIVIGLEDDLGNQYVTDDLIATYIDGVEDLVGLEMLFHKV